MSSVPSRRTVLAFCAVLAAGTIIAFASVALSQRTSAAAADEITIASPADGNSVPVGNDFTVTLAVTASTKKYKSIQWEIAYQPNVSFVSAVYSCSQFPSETDTQPTEAPSTLASLPGTTVLGGGSNCASLSGTFAGTNTLGVFVTVTLHCDSNGSTPVIIVSNSADTNFGTALGDPTGAQIATALAPQRSEPPFGTQGAINTTCGVAAPPTSTPAPPTNTPPPATNTPLPKTNTPLPATNTPLPATNTRTSTTTSTSTAGAASTNTPGPSATPTRTSTATSTNTVTAATNTPGPSATFTATSTATSTSTAVPTSTNSPTATNTPLSTSTNTPPPASTNTAKPTATNTGVPTSTNSPTATNTALATSTRTSTPPPTSTNTPSAAPTPIETVTATIGAGGGTLSSFSGASVTIPPGALATDTLITLKVFNPADVPPPPAGFTILTAIDLGPNGLTFAVPVTITLHYSDAQLAGANPNQLGVWVFSSGSWSFLGGTVDTNAKTVTITVSHFTQYALMLNPRPVQCMTFGQKISLIIGIIRRLEVHKGDRRYKTKYDLNHDGVIDIEDLKIAIGLPVCRHHHDDDDDDDHGDRNGGQHDDDDD